MLRHLVLVAAIGCAQPSPVAVPVAPPVAPAESVATVSVRITSAARWVDIVVNGTDEAARRACDAMARRIVDVFVRNADLLRPCAARALPAIARVTGTVLVEDWPVDLMIRLAREPAGSATGTITQFTRFDTVPDCERAKSERDREGDHQMAIARATEIDLLSKEAERSDRDARTACAAGRADDCEVARLVAEKFREHVARLRSEVAVPTSVGECRPASVATPPREH